MAIPSNLALSAADIKPLALLVATAVDALAFHVEICVSVTNLCDASAVIIVAGCVLGCTYLFAPLAIPSSFFLSVADIKPFAVCVDKVYVVLVSTSPTKSYCVPLYLKV